MAEDVFEVGVLVAKRRLRGPWQGHAWLPRAVLPGVPAAAPWTRLAATAEEDIYYAGSFALRLHRSETAHYRDNLRAEQPSLWVALRPVGDEVEVAAVTADPYEGEALTEGLGEIVEAVPMPAEIREKVAAFFTAFHVERPFVKRRRDRGDPEALARRGPALRGDDEA